MNAIELFSVTGDTLENPPIQRPLKGGKEEARRLTPQSSP